jgi:hypothetical protein
LQHVCVGREWIVAIELVVTDIAWNAESYRPHKILLENSVFTLREVTSLPCARREGEERFEAEKKNAK